MGKWMLLCKCTCILSGWKALKLLLKLKLMIAYLCFDLFLNESVLTSPGSVAEIFMALAMHLSFDADYAEPNHASF